MNIERKCQCISGLSLLVYACITLIMCVFIPFRMQAAVFSDPESFGKISIIDNECMSSDTSVTYLTVCENAFPYTWHGHVIASPGFYVFSLSGGNYEVLDIDVYPAPSPLISMEHFDCTDLSGYLQAPDNMVSYLWSTGAVTQTLTVPQAGTYGVTVTDVHNCTYSGEKLIHITVNPIASVSVHNMCAGSDQFVDVSYTGTPSIFVGNRTASLVVSDTIFLPDGVYCSPYGCSYRSPVNFDVFPEGATVTSVNDIRYVRIKMEHSYAKDIYINITCPNGQKADILKYGGSGSSSCNSSIAESSRGWQGPSVSNAFGGTFFGVPVDDYGSGCSPTPMGIGWNYCWSNNNTEGYQYAPGAGSLIYRAEHAHSIDNWDDSFDSTNVANKTNMYHPDQSFASLIGCPLNGNWFIEVVDGWSVDNGYLFEWELMLSSNLMPQEQAPVTGMDVIGPWSQAISDTSAIISPPATLESDVDQAYTFIVYEEDGCHYDTVQTIHIHVPVVETYYDTICQGTAYNAHGFSKSASATNTPGNFWLKRRIAPPGSYNVPCFDSVKVLLTINPKPSVAPTATPAQICKGDTAVLQITGGVSYQWKQGQTVISTDSVVSVSPVNTTSYSVIVVNEFACSKTFSKSITVRPLPTVSISGDTLMCYGDSVRLQSSSASNNVWSTGETTRAIWVKPSQDSTYSVTVTNTYGCSASSSKSVYVYYVESTRTVDSACLSYTWFGTQYTQSGTYLHIHPNEMGCMQVDTLQLQIFTPHHQAVTEQACEFYVWEDGQTYTTSGVYTRTFPDSHGCLQTDTLHLTVYHVVNTSESVMSCEPYSWNGTTYTTSGIYTYTHLTSENCTQVDTLKLTVTEKPSIVGLQTSDATCGEDNGEVEVYISGGVSPIRMFYLPGMQEAALDNLPEGDYHLKVIDSLTCFADTSFTINQVEHSVGLASLSPAHCGRNDGEVEVQVSGGYGPFTYHWSNGETTQEGALENLFSGNYKVQVIDVNNCVREHPFTVEEIPGPDACFYFDHNNDYEMVLVNCTAGDVVDWSWSFGDGNVSDLWAPVHQYAEPGNYLVSLTVSDLHQCIDSVQKVYVINEIPTFYLPSAFYPKSEITENQTFGPRGQSIAEEEYEMYIYDRWGEQVFESHLPSQAWDGTFNGADAPAGEYVYRVIYRDLNGGWHTTRGKVMLLR